MNRLLQRFVQDEGGATAIEYGLLVTVISLVVIAAVTATGKTMWNTLNSVSAALVH